MKDWIREHKNNKDQEAVILQHKTKYTHEFDREDVQILDIENNYKKRLVSEMIHIQKNIKNPINDREDTQMLSNIYNRVINV